MKELGKKITGKKCKEDSVRQSRNSVRWRQAMRVATRF